MRYQDIKTVIERIRITALDYFQLSKGEHYKYEAKVLEILELVLFNEDVPAVVTSGFDELIDEYADAFESD